MPTLRIVARLLHPLAWLVCLPGAAAQPAAPPPVDRQQVIDRLPQLHLLEPLWAGPVVHRESVLPLIEPTDGRITGRLAFPAQELLAVASADGSRRLEIGQDVQLGADGLLVVFTPQAAPAAIAHTELFPPADSGKGYRHRRDHPEQNLLFAEGHWFHDRQFEVSYRRKDDASWPGKSPVVAPHQLPRAKARLQARQPLSMGVSGDSISHGLNASGVTGAAPQMPGYPDLVAAQLEASFGGPVTLRNRAVPGWSVTHGIADLAAWRDDPPQLLIVAYGMNDVGRRDPAWFGEQTRTLLTQLHEFAPQTEVVLVAPMLGYAQWIHTPREMFPKYRDALAALATPAVALADLTEVWTVLLARKHDLDLTGNGLNHPNDFGHRLYAQAILALFLPPASSSAADATSTNSSR